MPKFVYTTDWHIRSRPSDNIGIEDYQRILLERIAMVLDTDADFVLHGGDMFHTPEIDDMNLFNSVVKLLYDYGKEIYVVPGSHDMIGYSPDSLNWSCLNTLSNAGLLTVLTPGKHCIKNVPVFVIYPTKEHSIELYRGLSDTVVVSHNILSPVPLTFPHIKLEEVARVVSQCLVLCADLHMPFSEFFDTCAFLNPGPLLKSSLSDKAEEGGFFMLDVDPTTFACSYKKILFPDIEISVKMASKKLKEFSNKLVFESPASDVIELVTQVSNKMYNDPVITKEAIEWIKSKS